MRSNSIETLRLLTERISKFGDTPIDICKEVEKIGVKWREIVQWPATMYSAAWDIVHETNKGRTGPSFQDLIDHFNRLDT